MSKKLTSQPEQAVAAEAAPRERDLLEQIATRTAERGAGPGPAPAPLVGEVVDDRHPALMGRARVRWTGGAEPAAEAWLPCLQGVVVRRGDRVLLQRPANWPEPLVVGVVDGFARRPEVPRRPGAEVELRGDECLRVRAEDGQGLVEVYRDESGPVVKLLSADAAVDLPGELRVSADSIRLEARAGGVRIRASDDVDVEGELINLN